MNIFKTEFQQIQKKYHDSLISKNNTKKQILLYECISSIDNLVNTNSQFSDESWHLAYQIDCYNDLKNKIEFIENESTNLNYSFVNIKNKISTRTIALTESLIQTTRLPIGSSKFEKLINQDIKDAIKLKDLTHLHLIERQSYNLVVDCNKTKQIIKNPLYEGSDELLCAQSWKLILKQFLQDENPNDRQIQSILDQINKGMPLFKRMVNAACYASSKIPEENRQKNYFHDWVMAASKTGRMSLGGLLRKYKVHTDNIPLLVIINSLTWDILDNIKELKINEPLLLVSGTKFHSILIQIICRKSADGQNEGEYEYKIFNTGNGTWNNHRVDIAKNTAFPLTYEKLKKSAFSYSFISRLIETYLSGEDVSKFYHFHEHYLMNLAGGKKVLSKGAMYPLQSIGNCGFKAFEAFSCNEINESTKFQKLQDIKVKVAIHNLELAMDIIQKIPEQTNHKRKSEMDPLFFEPPAKRIKYDKTILAMGKEYIKEHSTPDSNQNR